LWTFFQCVVPSAFLSESIYSGIQVSFLKELFSFLRARKKLWLAPMLIVMALLGVLIVMTHGSAIAPFIYTLF
jgi:hypothetical protein